MKAITCMGLPVSALSTNLTFSPLQARSRILCTLPRTMGHTAIVYAPTVNYSLCACFLHKQPVMVKTYHRCLATKLMRLIRRPLPPMTKVSHVEGTQARIGNQPKGSHVEVIHDFLLPTLLQMPLLVTVFSCYMSSKNGHVRHLRCIVGMHTLLAMPSLSSMVNSFFLSSFMQASMTVLMGSYTNWQKPRLQLAAPVCFLVHFLVLGSKKLSPAGVPPSCITGVLQACQQVASQQWPVQWCQIHRWTMNTGSCCARGIWSSATALLTLPGTAGCSRSSCMHACIYM